MMDRQVLQHPRYIRVINAKGREKTRTDQENAKQLAQNSADVKVRTVLGVSHLGYAKPLLRFVLRCFCGVTSALTSAFRRGVAQSGSAIAWGAIGRWFKSSHPDQQTNLTALRGRFFCVQIFPMTRP